MTQAASKRLHSTHSDRDVRYVLRCLAKETWEQHQKDVEENHRWLESFIETVKEAGAVRKKGAARPLMSELMKTPGRSREANKRLSLSSKKDFVATLLFPAPIPSFANKENNLTTSVPIKAVSTKRSANTKSTNSAIVPLRSPFKLTSPRQTSQKQQIESILAEDATSPPREENDNRPTAIPKATEDEKANLSIIGEEEEDEDTSLRRHMAAVNLSSTSTVLASDTSGSGPFSSRLPDLSLNIAAAKGNFVSPQLVLNSTSSTNKDNLSSADAVTSSDPLAFESSNKDAQEEDSSNVEADADEAVPLNDASSAKTTTTTATSMFLPDATSGPSSSVTSTARTPAGTSRLGPGTYSAAKPLTLGNSDSSSPHSQGLPFVNANLESLSSRPSTGSGLMSSSNLNHISTLMGSINAQATGRAQLNFVGLPKKSLGLGLGLGRSMGSSVGRGGANAASSESQGIQISQATERVHTPAAVSTNQPSAIALLNNTTISTSGLKRKSLAEPDLPNKSAARITDAKAMEELASKARRDALASRLQSMGATRKQSTAARVSGLPGQTLAFSTGGLGMSRSAQFQAESFIGNQPTASSSIYEPFMPERKSLFTQSVSVAPPAASTTTLLDSSLHSVSPLSIQHSQGTGNQEVMSSVTNKLPVTATPKLVKKSSVNVREAAKAFERSGHSDTIPLSPLKPSAAAIAAMTVAASRANLTLSPKSPKRTAAVPPSMIARPISPTQATIPRMVLRSPPRAQNPPPPITAKSPARNAKGLPSIISTTPKGSPPAIGTRSIMQQLSSAATQANEHHHKNTAKDLFHDEMEEDTIRAVNSDIANSGFGRTSPNIAPLPPQLDRNGNPLSSDADETQRSEVPSDVIVEKGRGAFVNAMDSRLDDDVSLEHATVSAATEVRIVKTSPSKIIMPGTFGAAYDGEDEHEQHLPVTAPNMNRHAAPTGPILHKKGSQSSLASTQSSSGVGGMLSFLKPFGNGKKVDGKVKSIQLAAAAAVKEQEEKVRKAALKEEREQRRIAVQQKKADEERQKLEEEKKSRALDLERKRRETEERAAKVAALALKSKMIRQTANEEPTKKRKMEVEIKRVVSKGQPASRPPSTHPQLPSDQASLRAIQSHAGKVSSTTSSNSTVGFKYNEQVRTTTASQGQTGLPARVAALNTSVNGKAQSHFSAASTSKTSVPQEPEPYQELPDIDSEYSDSDDEGHEEKAKALPDWAQSPALTAALYRQQNVNPDDIFGPIPPLQMQQIFRSKDTNVRISKRTSSACWEGTDALTEADMARYNRQMGFTRGVASSLSRHT